MDNIELMRVDLSFGVTQVVDKHDESVVLSEEPTAVLTVVACGAGVPALQDDPVEMLRIMMQQISDRYSEGMIVPEKTYDYRSEQADGSPE